MINEFIFRCLHCEEYFIINRNEFNCKILRHAVYKHNMEPINPHLPKDDCDRLVKEDLVYGCAKPLMIIQKNNEDFNVEICNYI
jgi:hypothetical protein